MNVSCIIPAYNSAAYVREAIDSVCAQGRDDCEIIVVDDGSTDTTPQVLAPLQAAGTIRYIRQENAGPAAARNAGIRAARGRYLSFLDADDLWRPAKLEVQIGYMEATGAVFSFAALERIDVSGRVLGRISAPPRVDYARLLRGNVIPCQTAAFDRDHYGAVEMPDLPRRQDYGLWLMLLKGGGEAHGIDEVLASWRMRPGSLSANKLKAAVGTWRVYREVAGLGRGAAAARLAGNLARGVAKRV